MAKFSVRITGTAPMWADVEVEAESAQEALDKVDNGDIPDLKWAAPWEMSEGNGVDDWSTTGEVFDAEGDLVLEEENA